MATIAFIGFGEAGQDISQGLIGEGARVPAAFDILFPDNEKGQRLRDAAMARTIWERAASAPAAGSELSETVAVSINFQRSLSKKFISSSIQRF